VGAAIADAGEPVLADDGIWPQPLVKNAVRHCADDKQAYPSKQTAVATFRNTDRVIAFSQKIIPPT